MTASKEKAPGQGGFREKTKVIQFQFSNLEVDQVKGAFPDPRFLPGRVLMRLLAGRRLTHKDSWLELGHARLADSIWKLRKMGWPVQMDEESMPTSDGDRRASVGFYYLTPEVIEAVGETGRRYSQGGGSDGA